MRSVTVTNEARSIIAPELYVKAYKKESKPDGFHEGDVPKTCIAFQGSIAMPFQVEVVETSNFRYDGAAVAESPITIYDASGMGLRKLRDRTRIYQPHRESNVCLDVIDKADSFYRRFIGKNPVDSHNKEIVALMGLDKAYNNAYWNGRYIAFGEVDPRIFAFPLYRSPDIVTHELGHAVVTYSGELEYKNQTGALNESIADVFAIIKKHQEREVQQPKVTEQRNWYIGEGVLANDNGVGALRRFDAPGTAFDHPMLGKDQQPAHMNDYLYTEEDSGGVHTNSGIPNKAFYNAAIGLQNPIWEKVGQIWAEALDKSHSKVTFSEFAINTIKAARAHGGEGPINIVGKAWQDVGVDLRRGALDESDKMAVISLSVVPGAIGLVGADYCGFGTAGSVAFGSAVFLGSVIAMDNLITSHNLRELGLRNF